MDTERKVTSMSKSESIKNYSLRLDSKFLGTSLNKANQQERRVDKFLLSRQYDEAIKCHEKAAEYLLEAIEKTKSLDALQVLQLKYDHHKRQPALLRETQRREKQKKQLFIEMSEKDEETDINAKQTNEAVTANTDNGHENAHPEEDQYDSVENADSLLHVLKENSKEENGNITYRTPYLLSYFKANPLASWMSPSDGKPRAVFTKKTCSKRPSFEKDKIIHELNVTIMTLAKDLHSCEEENKYLKDKVSDLERELETNNCRDNKQDEVSPLLLNLPFSSTGTFDTSNPDNFQLHSLQPLSEIDMPEI